jgi:hypothetical protein
MGYCQYGLVYNVLSVKTIISNTYFRGVKFENCNIIACFYGVGEGGFLASRRVATGLYVDGNSHSLYMQCVLLQFEERKGYIRVWNSQKSNNRVGVLHGPLWMLC